MKQKSFLAVASFCLSFAALFLIGGCENLYVQQLLRAGATIDSIQLEARPIPGSMSVYNFQPAFDPSNLGPYYVRVPGDVDEVQLSATPHRDGDIKYEEVGSGITNANGRFSFPSTTILVPPPPIVAKSREEYKIHVERSHMNNQVYTVIVSRGTNPLLDFFATGIPVVSGTPGTLGVTGTTPLYNDEIFDYDYNALKSHSQIRLGASLNVTDAQIPAIAYLKVDHTLPPPAGSLLTGHIAPGAVSSLPADSLWSTDVYDVSILGSGQGDTGETGGPYDTIDAAYPNSIRFSAAVGNPTDIYIKVWNTLNPSTSVSIYRLSIVWPHSVATIPDGLPAAPPSGSVAYGTYTEGVSVDRYYKLNYDTSPHYEPGDPVSFSLVPPFGNTTSKVVYVTTADSVEHPVDIVDSDEYSFIMPSETDVKIRASYRPVPAPGGGTVRFVSPRGSGSQDGLSWTNAAPGTQLQNLIDNVSGYEIWLAQGDYYPNWAASTTAQSLTGWASELTAPFIADKMNWAIVLKSGVKIYGGFRGTETSKEANPTAAKPNNLSYRIYTDGAHAGGGNTKLKFVSRITGTMPVEDGGDVVFHTMIAAGPGGETAYLDGLTVSGSANPYWPGSDITVAGKSIKQNYGGALYINGFSPVLKNVTLRGGLANYSAGVYIIGNSKPVFLHCYLTDHQSADYGSAIGIDSDANSHLLMIGGSMGINLDAGGVLYIGAAGKATLVNVSISNNKDAAVFGTGDGIFINCSIEGNRWVEISEPNVVNTGVFYNSVIYNNQSQLTNALVTFYNTVVTGHAPAAGLLPDAARLSPNNGLNQYYPLNDTLTDWRWISNPYDATLQATFTTLISQLPGGAEALVKDALKYDGIGKPRLSGIIDLGALE